MRPYKFSPLAPNKGLTIANGALSGLNQSLQNLSKMRMQKAQMEVHRANAEAMKMYRTAQAESMRQKAMGGTAADIRLLNAISKGEHIDPSVLKPLLKDKVQTLLDTAKPEEKAALAKHLEDQMNAGEVPGEVMPYININANQLRSMDKTAGNVAKQGVADTQAGAKVKSAGIYADSRVKVGELGKEGRLGAATIMANRPNSAHSPDTQLLKDSNARMLQIHKSIDSLDKPTPLGATPMDPDLKDRLRNKYENDLVKEHENYNSISERVRGGGSAAAPGAPSNPPPATGTPQPPAPKYLPSDQHQSAQPGDFVQGQGGYMKATKRANGTIGPEMENGAPKIYPAPQAAPQGAPGAPQAAPGGAGVQPPPGMGMAQPGGDGLPPVPPGLGPQNLIPGME